MFEKEIKILDINTIEVCKKLEEYGAEKTFEGFVHDIYYDFLGDKMQAENRIFRVRQKGETHLYTIKRKRGKMTKNENLNIKDEHETKITDIKSFSSVLEKYGMHKTREKKKYRISYSLDGLEFDIDDYYIGDNKNLIPPLLEIEVEDKKQVKERIKKLDLKDNVKKLFGSRGLFKYYGQDYSIFEIEDKKEE